MPVKSLPSNPSLAHLKYQARDLQKGFQVGQAEALARIREFHPKFARAKEQQLREIWGQLRRLSYPNQGVAFGAGIAACELHVAASSIEARISQA